MDERKFQASFFSPWASRQNFGRSIGWELKLTKGRSIPFNAVSDHQIEKLLDVKYRGMYHKIEDPNKGSFKSAKNRFSKPRPFDCFFLLGDAYVVLIYYKIRQPKITYWIDIDVFLKEKESSERKSITESRAEEIATEIYVIKRESKKSLQDNH